MSRSNRRAQETKHPVEVPAAPEVMEQSPVEAPVEAPVAVNRPRNLTRERMIASGKIAEEQALLKVPA